MDDREDFPKLNQQPGRAAGVAGERHKLVLNTSQSGLPHALLPRPRRNRATETSGPLSVRTCTWPSVKMTDPNVPSVRGHGFWRD